jgi:hypothetical protein
MSPYKLVRPIYLTALIGGVAKPSFLGCQSPNYMGSGSDVFIAEKRFHADRHWGIILVHHWGIIDATSSYFSKFFGDGV